MAELNEQPKSEQPTELVPFEIIRTETVLSKLPTHNLAKKGKANIHITKKNDQGETDLYWKVSPNPDFGEPRQLAYKLDTIVINRRIDEEGKPLPQRIRLGSLREICKELGLSASGDNFGGLKKALLQNASTFITAKLKYKGNDGSERTLEAGFTRYTIIFTGEKLPDGTRADAVYVELHPRYHEVLNNAPDRPLDYAYLKELPPAPQRFYEIVSYRIFTAIKYKHSQAKIPYSEYCMFSAQQRYYDYDHFKKQMYKIHRPHKDSGYLAKVSYEATTDSEGKADWMLYYTPGPKARAEYRAFHKKQKSPKEDSLEREGQSGTYELQVSEKSKAPTPPSLQTPDAVSRVQAGELVRHFYFLFHKIQDATAQPKELEQAARLIADHSFATAKHVVEFAFTVAPETKFQPQTFGGILHYTARAVADYQQQNKARQTAQANKQRQRHEERQLQAERARQEQLEAQYRTLPPATQAALSEQARVSLRQQGVKEEFLFDTALKSEIYRIMAEQKAKRS